MMSYKFLTPLKITWLDAASDNSGWQVQEDVNTELQAVQTIGFFFDENEDAITLVQAILGDSELFTGSFVIPKKNIIKTEVLNGTAQENSE